MSIYPDLSHLDRGVVAWLRTLVPILISLSRKLVSDHGSAALGIVSGRMKLPIRFLWAARNEIRWRSSPFAAKSSGCSSRAGAGGARNRGNEHQDIREHLCDSATSANWNATRRRWLMTLAPMLIRGFRAGWSASTARRGHRQREETRRQVTGLATGKQRNRQLGVNGGDPASARERQLDPNKPTIRCLG
jgi:hypothetical protein